MQAPLELPVEELWQYALSLQSETTRVHKALQNKGAQNVVSSGTCLYFAGLGGILSKALSTAFWGLTRPETKLSGPMESVSLFYF